MRVPITSLTAGEWGVIDCGIGNGHHPSNGTHVLAVNHDGIEAVALDGTFWDDTPGYDTLYVRKINPPEIEFPPLKYSDLEPGQRFYFGKNGPVPCLCLGEFNGLNLYYDETYNVVMDVRGNPEVRLA